MIIRSNWGWEDCYWNLPQAVEQAVNIWYESDLVDINSLIVFPRQTTLDPQQSLQLLARNLS